MKCRQVEQWMDAALDEGGAGLAPRRRAELDQHLHACPQCRGQWEVLRQAESALRVPRPAPAPDGMLLEFRRRLAAEPAPAPRPSFWTWVFPVGSLAAAGAAAAVMIAMGVHVTTPTSKTVNLPGVPGPQAKAPAPPIEQHFYDLTEKSVAASPARPSAQPDTAAKKRPAARRIRPEEPRTRMAKADDRVTSLSLARPDVYRHTDRAAGGGSLETVRESLVTGHPAPPFAGGRALVAFSRDAYTADSPEVNVSPAVLTALNRTVEVAARSASVQQVAQQLALEADVQLQVDPSAAQLRVSVTEDQAPLWKALESVAKQQRLEIVPVENHLVLMRVDRADKAKTLIEKEPREAVVAKMPRQRTEGAVMAKSVKDLQEKRLAPSEAAVARKPADPRVRLGQNLDVTRQQGGFGGSAQAGAAPGPAAPAVTKPAPAGPAGPRALTRNEHPAAPDARPHPEAPAPTGLRALATNGLADHPDRAVWPAAWGTLPERGFTPIAPEELGPQIPAAEAPRATVAPQNNLRRNNRLPNGR